MSRLKSAIIKTSILNDHFSYEELDREDQDVIISGVMFDEPRSNLYDFIDSDVFDDIPMAIAKVLEMDNEDNRDLLVRSIKSVARKHYDKIASDEYHKEIDFNSLFDDIDRKSDESYLDYKERIVA